MPPHRLFPRQRLQRAHRQIGRHAAPETIQRLDRASGAAFDQPLHHHGAIDRARGSARKTIEVDALIFQQALHGTPGKGAMRAAALQRKTKALLRNRLGNRRRCQIFQLALWPLPRPAIRVHHAASHPPSMESAAPFTAPEPGPHK